MSLQFFLVWNSSSFFVFHDLGIFEPLFQGLWGTALELNSGFYSHTLILFFIQWFSYSGLDFIFENYSLLLALDREFSNLGFFFVNSSNWVYSSIVLIFIINNKKSDYTFNILKNLLG